MPFQFKCTVGDEDILPRYPNSATNKITSTIEIEFANSFPADLGTGKLAGEEVACLPIAGITLSSTDRITCRLYPSVSPTTYPLITVTGYDRISAATDVIIQIAGLQTLPDSVNDFIKIGVALTYFDYGGVQGYVYERTGIVVGGTTPAITPYSISNLTVVEASTNFVGSLVNYSFTGTVEAGFSPVTPADYIAVEFEPAVLEGKFSTNMQALCSIAANSKCYSFGLSHTIYFHPSATFSSSTLAFSLNQVINSAYSLSYVDTTFTVKTVVGGRVNALGTASLTKFSKPSKNITGLVTQTDSLYGGDSGINYYIQFKLNSDLPTDGLIVITLPSIYDSLFSLQSSCVLQNLPIGSYCSVVNSNIVAIYPNGNLLNKDLTYLLTLTNITNPNADLTGYSFTIVSQANDNIYRPDIIAKNTFSCPAISLVSVN